MMGYWLDFLNWSNIKFIFGVFSMIEWSNFQRRID